jgi:hypothetical protein
MRLDYQKWMIKFYRRTYTSITRICIKHGFYTKYPFLRVLNDATEYSQSVIKFKICGSISSNNASLPDFYINNEFQLKLLSNYSVSECKSEYNFGIIELENAFFSFPYPIHRIRNFVVRKALGDNIKYLCEPRYLWGYLSTFTPLRRNLDTAILLAIPAYENFYHWMIETLPRLRMIENNPEYDSIPVVLPKKRTPKFIFESIDLCGFKDRVQYLESGSYSVEKLLIPTLCSPRNQPCEETVEWLNTKFLGSNKIEDCTPDTKIYSKIYVSRDDAETRGVHNSHEVDNLLTNLGFKKVSMSDYTVKEQAFVFSNAEIIVGIHGAALTNIVFARPGCKFIEIFMEGWFTRAFFNLAKLRKIDYGYLLCQKVDSNIDIDLHKLETLIENASD